MPTTNDVEEAEEEEEVEVLAAVEPRTAAQSRPRRLTGDTAPTRSLASTNGQELGQAKHASSQELRVAYEKRSTVKRGVQHEVEELLAMKVDPKGKQLFLVRWKDGVANDDCWEPQANVEPSLIAAFESSTLEKVVVRGRGKNTETWLIDERVDSRVNKGKSQSLVRWHGYNKRPLWQDDDKLELAVRNETTTVLVGEGAATAQPASSSAKPAKRAAPAPLPGNPKRQQVEATEPVVPRGFNELMDKIADNAKAAALEWCNNNDVADVALIADLDAVDEFIGALGLKDVNGLAAKALRKRLNA